MKKKLKNRVLVMAALLVSTSALGDDAVKIGDSLKAYQYKDLYFSGQPSQPDYAALKEQGFTHIVNLRKSEEGSYREASEKAEVKKTGLVYSHTPWTGDFSGANIKEITSSVVRHRKKGKTLVHCGSGNRVGEWLAIHFHKDHGLSKTDALEKAKSLGLKMPGEIEKTKAALERL